MKVDLKHPERQAIEQYEALSVKHFNTNRWSDLADDDDGSVASEHALVQGKQCDQNHGEKVNPRGRSACGQLRDDECQGLSVADTRNLLMKRIDDFQARACEDIRQIQPADVEKWKMDMELYMATCRKEASHLQKKA